MAKSRNFTFKGKGKELVVELESFSFNTITL